MNNFKTRFKAHVVLLLFYIYFFVIWNISIKVMFVTISLRVLCALFFPLKS